jgi:glutathione S-transferase
MFLPESERNPQAIAAAEEALERPLPVLDGALSETPYLLGDSFTIADLNVAGVLSTAQFVGFDYSKYANAQRWSEACMSRPAFLKAGSL